MIRSEPSLDELAAAVTGRRRSLFEEDRKACAGGLNEKLTGARVLVIGGAGSIGAATVKRLAGFEVAALHVIDQSENALVELVRDLRSGAECPRASGMRFQPLDFGSGAMSRHLAGERPYDYVLHFAAHKHVRSEKDSSSVLQMLETNVVKTSRLMGWLSGHSPGARFFAVSTDKAADPINLMGASKAVMEQLLFSRRFERGTVSSARFANVAFSGGSLLEGFLQRLRKRQPLAVPEGTRRYLVTLEESGEICLLAAVVAPDRSIVIPKLSSQRHTVDLESVAVTVLRRFGLKAVRYRNEEEARSAVGSDLRRGGYPLLITPLDTTGEKKCEIFAGKGEKVRSIGRKRLEAVVPRAASPAKLRTFLRRVEEALTQPKRPIDKDEIVGWFREVLPNFRHEEAGRSLDDRM